MTSFRPLVTKSKCLLTGISAQSSVQILSPKAAAEESLIKLSMNGEK